MENQIFGVDKTWIRKNPWMGFKKKMGKEKRFRKEGNVGILSPNVLSFPFKPQGVKGKI